MKWNWLDWLLVAAIIVGSVSFVRVQTGLMPLQREHARIVAEVGTLEIEDDQQAHVRAIDTQNPWQWAWRVYLPDNAKGSLRYSIGDSGSGGSLGYGSSAQQFIARVSLNEVQDGRLGLYVRFLGSSGFSSFATPAFSQFIREHRQQLNIEQFAAESTERMNAGDPPARFFRISLPDDLAREAKQKFPNEKLIPTLLEVLLECQ